MVAEIQAIIRQITASVTFLPLLQDRCAPLPCAGPVLNSCVKTQTSGACMHA